MALNYSILGKIMLVVLAVSLVWGYWVAIRRFLPLILIESGYSLNEITGIVIQNTIISIVVGFGTSVLLLVVNYYLGKQYKLGKTPTVVFFLVLVTAGLIGNIIGYGIRQLEYPEYPILSIYFLIEIFGPYGPSIWLSLILWSFIGMLAANYKRELEKTHAELKSTI